MVQVDRESGVEGLNSELTYQVETVPSRDQSALVFRGPSDFPDAIRAWVGAGR